MPVKIPEVAGHGLNYYAGRVATIIGVVINIAAVLAAFLADVDLESLGGIGAALAGIDALLLKFQHGAQKHEDRVAILDAEYAGNE